MANSNDILLDGLDLKIKDGDFHVGLAEGQHVELLLRCEIGNLKEYPLVGCGITSTINGQVDGVVRKQIRLQLERDGFKVRQITYKSDILTIDATR